MKALVLSSSPRRNGNSALLAQAASEGLREAGHASELVYADDVLEAFLVSTQLLESEVTAKRVVDMADEILIGATDPAQRH